MLHPDDKNAMTDAQILEYADKNNIPHFPVKGVPTDQMLVDDPDNCKHNAGVSYGTRYCLHPKKPYGDKAHRQECADCPLREPGHKDYFLRPYVIGMVQEGIREQQEAEYHELQNYMTDYGTVHEVMDILRHWGGYPNMSPKDITVSLLSDLRQIVQIHGTNTKDIITSLARG